MPDAAALTVRVNADTSAAEAGLASLGQKVNDFGSSVRAGFGIGAGIAAFQEGLHLLEGGFDALKSNVFDFNQQLDQAHAVFTRYFQGSQTQADAFLSTLKQFANVTPFEFKDLVPLAVKLQNANVNAQDIIPTIKAIGEASSSTGQISAQSIDRIGLALTQMQQTGHVTGQDMRQLTEALVPAWQILADATGKPIPVLQKLASEGQISSQTFIDAFRKYYDGANLMETASKTLGGALSTVGDVGTQALADIGRSIYDLATQGANQLATFLSSDQFAVWVQAGKAAVDAMVEGFKGLMTALAPLGSAISDAFSKATQGDFSGALTSLSNGVKTQLGIIWDTVTDFGSRMLGAGSNVIESFADGMLSGGMKAIEQAMDVITSFIASLLIGNSPPTAGPLAAIDQGGTNVAMAWVRPFGDTLKGGVTDAVGAAALSFKGLGDAAGTAGTTAAGSINALKDASLGVAAQIQGLTDQMHAVDQAMRPIKDSIADLKAGFAAQKQAVQDLADTTRDKYAVAIQGVRDQIDGIKDSHEHAAAAVQAQIDAVKDRLGPAIDGVKARIDDITERYRSAEDAVQRQIDGIKDRYGPAIDSLKDKIAGITESYGSQEASIQKHIDLLKDQYTTAIDGVRDRIASITDAEQSQLDPLQKQIALLQDANKYVRERQDAEQAIANAATQQFELQALGDPAVRAQLGGQLAALSVQQQTHDLAQQIADIQAKIAAGGLTDNQRQSLEIQKQQLEIQLKLAAMVDTTKLAEATRQKDLEDAQAKQLAATRAIQDADQNIYEIPLEQKMQAIQQAAEAALAPLQRHLKDLENGQKQALDPLEAHLKSVKQQADDALTPLQTRLKGLESSEKDALDPLQQRLRTLKGEEQDLLLPLQTRLKGLETDQKNALDPLDQHLRDIKRDEANLLAPLQDRLQGLQKESDTWGRAFSTALADIDRQQREAVSPLQSQLDILQHQKDTLSDQKQELESIKASIQEQIALQQQAQREAKAAGGPAPGPVDRSFTGDPTAGMSADAAKARGAALAQSLADGFSTWFESHRAQIAESVIGAGLGLLIGGPLGAAVGAAFAPQFVTTLNAKLKEHGFDAQVFIQTIADGLSQGDWGPVGEALGHGFAAAFFGTIPAIRKTLAAELKAWFTGDNADLEEAVKTGVGGFVDSIVKYITQNPGNVAETLLTVILLPESWLGALGIVLGKIPIVGGLLAWITNVFKNFGLLLRGGGASPLEEAWSSIVDAFGDGILGALRSLPGRITSGLVNLFRGLFTRGAGGAGNVASTIEADFEVIGSEAADSFAGSAARAIPAAIGRQLATIGGSLKGAAGTIEADFEVIGSETGGNLVSGLVQGMKNALPTLEGWLATGFGILNLLRRIFRSRSPSEEMADLGADLVDGLTLGLQSRWNASKKWVEDFGQTFTNAFNTYIGGPAKWLVDAGGKVLGGLKDGWDQVWAAGGQGIGSIEKWLGGFGSTITTTFSEGGGGVTTWLTESGGKLLGGVKSGWDAMWSAGAQGAGSVHDWLATYGPTIVTTFSDGAGGVATWLSKAGGDLLAGLKTGWDMAWSTGSEQIGSIEKWLGGFGGSVVSAFTTYAGGPLNWLVQVGGDLLKGLQQGISNMLGDGPEQFWGWLKLNLIDKIPQKIREILNLDADTGALAMVGERMVKELEIGISNRWPSLNDLWKRLSSSLGGGDGLAGVDLRLAIQGIGSAIGGDEFGRVAAAVAVSEGALNDPGDPGSGGAVGPFQFDPNGELQAFASALGLSVSAAADVARQQPLRAADWALEGYLGAAIHEGLERGLHSADLANYASRYGQRPQGSEIDDPNDPAALWARAGQAYRDLFPGLALGGIVMPRPGGVLANLAEAGQPEAVIPLPSNWQPGATGGGDVYLTINVTVGTSLANRRDIEDAVVVGVESAVRRQRLSPTILRQGG